MESGNFILRIWTQYQNRSNPMGYYHPFPEYIFSEKNGSRNFINCSIYDNSNIEPESNLKLFSNKVDFDF